MHFIKKNGYKRFSKTNSADLRQRVPLTYSSFMAFGKFRALKERYRIGKKQKSSRSEIYIKPTRSNDDDDDSLKYSLKFSV